MNIKWLGHASFLITSQDNIRVITDPYNTGNGLSYAPINESADIVTISHGHGDHNNIKAVKGTPVVLKEAGSRTARGIEFKAIPTFHDEAGGSKRGNNLIFCFNLDGINICHLGDLGHQLSQQQLSQIEQVDVLIIPVGGYFTIDAKEAAITAQALKAKIIIPMHYKTSKCNYPISQVDDFLKGKENVRRLNASNVAVNKDTLTGKTEIIVLQSAL